MKAYSLYLPVDNSGLQVVFRYNTAYDNASWGFVTAGDTTVGHCIAVQQNGQRATSAGTQADNSWQRSGAVAVVSTTPGAPGFQRPTPGGGFEDLGAYAPTP